MTSVCYTVRMKKKNQTTKKEDIEIIEKEEATAENDASSPRSQPTAEEIEEAEKKSEYPGLKPEQIRKIKTILFVVLMIVAILLFVLKDNL